MILGIVGSEATKFNYLTERLAKDKIYKLVDEYLPEAISSGHCHLGGIDIWAEEIANELKIPTFIYPPKCLEWKCYAARNRQIARKSDRVVCITVRSYPESYKDIKFATCYHCQTNTHVKSGGCWTVKYAQGIDKDGQVIVI